MSVTDKNMKSYIQKLMGCLFNDSIKVQLEAFIRGISNVFKLSSLQLFMLDELEELISGEDTSKWNRSILIDNVIPDHGYTAASKTFCNFIDYMEGLNKHDMKDFLMFVTGSPRLPIGGLKNLTPKLTVVKRACPEF